MEHRHTYRQHTHTHKNKIHLKIYPTIVGDVNYVVCEWDANLIRRQVIPPLCPEQPYSGRIVDLQNQQIILIEHLPCTRHCALSLTRWILLPGTGRLSHGLHATLMLIHPIWHSIRLMNDWFLLWTLFPCRKCFLSLTWYNRPIPTLTFLPDSILFRSSS